MLLKEINASPKANLSRPKKNNNVNFTSTASAVSAIFTGPTPPPIPAQIRRSLHILRQATGALPKKLTDLLARQKKFLFGLTFEAQEDGRFVSQVVTPWKTTPAVDGYNNAFDNAVITAAQQATPNAQGVKQFMEDALTLRTIDFPYTIEAQGDRVILSEPCKEGQFFYDVKNPEFKLDKLNPKLNAYLETNGLGGLEEIQLANGRRFQIHMVLDIAGNPFADNVKTKFSGIGYQEI